MGKCDHNRKASGDRLREREAAMIVEKREKQKVELGNASFKLEVIENWKEGVTDDFESAATACHMFMTLRTSWASFLKRETHLNIC